jgi:hypothetical protein
MVSHKNSTAFLDGKGTVSAIGLMSVVKIYALFWGAFREEGRHAKKASFFVYR